MVYLKRILLIITTKPKLNPQEEVNTMHPENISREVFWNISKIGEVIFISFAVISTIICIYGFYVHIRRILQGKKVSLNLKNIYGVLASTFKKPMTNRKIFRQDQAAGLMHFFIAAGKEFFSSLQSIPFQTAKKNPGKLPGF